MNQYFIIFLLFLGFVTSAEAQKMSWRKHIKTADELFQQQKYLDAGEHYELAWRRKTDRLEYLYKSGECYFIIKNYLKAGEAFRIVRDRTRSFPIANLKYALCLKQRGKYDLAIKELNAFMLKQKDSKELANELILADKELSGCLLGIKMQKMEKTSGVDIEHLSANVNTLESEFAPIPFSGDILYFSSTMSGKARIYRSQRKAGFWIKAQEPNNFPEINAEHFCNGTFTPDLSRFYFTQCESVQTWGGLSSRCEIYVTKRENGTWTIPQRLRDYVNEKAATSTHPFVVHNNGKEILYFSSSREGGFGGMDIWYMERDLIDNGIDFSFPANAGPDINTSGDEITPYYDKLEKSLYFSSNGHINIGGFDIYKTQGAKATWSKAEILEAPINSHYDDYFYHTKPQSNDGFIVSNRLFGMEKINSNHEDIFAFYQPLAQAFVIGAVKDKLSKKNVKNVWVKLYELLGDGQKRLMIARKFKDGNYKFGLMPNRSFRLEAKSDVYSLNTFDFKTGDLIHQKEYGQTLLLQKKSNWQATANTNSIPKTRAVNNNNTTNNKPAPTPGSRTLNNNTIVKEKYTSRAKTPGEPFDIVSTAPRHQSIYYKVQLIAVVKYDPKQSRYNPVRNLGRFDTEYIPTMKLTRVLLADYFDLKSAESVLQKAIKHRTFADAYIVRYENGIRIGRWK